MTFFLRRWSPLAIYVYMAFFGVLQYVEPSPLVAGVQAQISWLGAGIWALLIGVGATLAGLGAWTAPTRARQGLRTRSAALMEVAGASFLTLAFAGFHASLIYTRGWAGVPASQIQTGSWWAFTLARAVEAALEARSSRWARADPTTEETARHVR